MKANKTIQYTCALLAILVLGCTGDFEEINTNPNIRPIVEPITMNGIIKPLAIADPLM